MAPRRFEASFSPRTVPPRTVPPRTVPARLELRARAGAASLLLLASAWSTTGRAEEAPAPAAPTPPAASEPVQAETTAAKPSAPTSAPASSPTAREQKALEAAKRRQAEAERGGDAALGRRLAALSARWLKVIAALEAAAKIEAEAAALENERIRVQEQTDRLISLVEQTEARRARALARLQALGLEPTASTPPSAKTGGAK